MQEIAPGGFQIMWKRYSVLLISTIWNASMTSPGLTSLYLSIPIPHSMPAIFRKFRRKNEHPMKIMTTFAESQYTMTIMNPINASHLLSAARAEFAVRGGGIIF